MTMVCKPGFDSSADVNLASARSELANKLQEIAPVMDFYNKLCLGWKRRLNLATSAQAQLPKSDKRNHEIMDKLIEVARKETVTTGKVYLDISNVKTAMEEKIQDLDFLALKNLNRSELTDADIGINDIKRLLYTSDALLELRGSEMKELTS